MGFEEDNADEESFILTEAIMTNGIITTHYCFYWYIIHCLDD